MGKWRVVANMLPVATGQIGYPIVNVILMKPDNRLVHSPPEYCGVRKTGGTNYFPKTSLSTSVTRAAGLVRIFCSSCASV